MEPWRPLHIPFTAPAGATSRAVSVSAPFESRSSGVMATLTGLTMQEAARRRRRRTTTRDENEGEARRLLGVMPSTYVPIVSSHAAASRSRAAHPPAQREPEQISASQAQREGDVVREASHSPPPPPPFPKLTSFPVVEASSKKKMTTFPSCTSAGSR
ncbi:hypothetical protein LX32DRAFT_13370 [Colletotrichum zoysiae]|uniref:Uncharacterized protein n=1 Tax=Colletotrichum zoysiae TaxID=1216348 RepID=A0AAD9HE68_9PEZI|nr:hypothetical protein LX32DRAFT_13370 [Colletotrichum zoysiae]